jgi:hypothetical protein
MRNFTLIIGLCFSTPVFAQSVLTSEFGGGEYHIHRSDEPCVSPEQYELIWEEIHRNQERLGLVPDPAKRGNEIPYQSPVATSDDNTWFNLFAISNYLDQDTGSGITDYNCGSRSYDGHNGTDYFAWPFQWYQYENELSHAVAAADGVIILKQDNNFDQSCQWPGVSAWNAVFVQHPNGSISWYGHLKAGGLTSKIVGETVTAGEFLGVIASSGFSSGSHLHFELYDAGENLVDPYSGDCNDLNTNSLWEVQEGYRDPQINALLTHDAEMVFGCPAEEEIPNLQNTFTINQTIYVAAYYRDQMVDDQTTYRLIDPNGTVVDQWTHVSPDTYSASYWWWTVSFPFTFFQGTYTFQAIYRGETYNHTFEFNSDVSSLGEGFAPHLKLFPNPSNDFFTLDFGEDVVQGEMKIYDLSGRLIQSMQVFNNSIQFGSDLAAGTYLLEVRSGNQSRSLPLVKL